MAIDTVDVSKVKVLLIDDEANSIKLMEAILTHAGYRNLRSSTDSRQAVALYQAFQPDLLVLDMNMPNLNGLEVMQALLPVVPKDDYFPILMITGELDSPTKHNALAQGAKDFLTKPVDPTEVTLRIANQLMTRHLHHQLRMQNEHLEAQVLWRTKSVEQTQLDLLYRLALAAGYRHDMTGSHAWRVGRIAGLLAELLGLPPAQVDMIKKTAPLHDVGKIGIPESVLLKTGPYDATDREVMRRHTKIGSTLLSGSTSPLLQMAREVALTHHERWDGAGYYEIKGPQIPQAGRIVAVADAFDVMAHRTLYREAMPLEQVRTVIEREAGKQFDPDVAVLMLQLIDRDGASLLADPNPLKMSA